ncbi:hypothetical protein KKB16_02755, partial [Patescibacteria group bacterium]|nr:hypothetical protein [Patescibacteria group bacterium]
KGRISNNLTQDIAHLLLTQSGLFLRADEELTLDSQVPASVRDILVSKKYWDHLTRFWPKDRKK